MKRLSSIGGGVLLAILLAGCTHTGTDEDEKTATSCNTTISPAAALCLASEPVDVPPDAPTGSIVADLDRVSERLTARNGEVRASVARTAAAEAGVERARAELMPDVNADAAIGLRHADRKPYAGPEPGDPASAGVAMTLPLWQGGGDVAAIDAAAARARAAAEASKSVLGRNMLQLALDILTVERRGKELAILADQERDLRRLRSEIAGERRAGDATAVDTEEVERQLARIAVDRKARELDRSRAVADILRIHGSMPTFPKGLPDLGGKLPTSTEGMIALAHANGSKIREATARTDAARADIRKVEAAGLPGVFLTVGARSEHNTSASLDRNDEVRADLKVRFPIFSGGRVEADVKIKEAEAKAAEEDAIAARDEAAATIRASVDRIRLSRRMAALSQTELAHGRRVRTGIAAERGVGDRSTFEEVRVTTDVAQARLSLVGAEYDARAAQYQIAYETGLLVAFADGAFKLAETRRTIVVRRARL